MILGQQRLWLPCCESTNDVAKAECQKGNLPLYVGCDVQTKGRGRLKRQWFDSPGTLCVTYCLQTSLPQRQYGLLSLAAGIAVTKIARSYVEDARLKWPNDVICSQGKLAGLLCETVYPVKKGLPPQGTYDIDPAKPAVLMGVGLNLRAPEGGFPEDIPAAALNCPMPLEQMAQTLYKQLYRDMKTLELDYKQTLRDWMSLGPEMHSPVMRQGIDGEMIHGRYAGLNEQGAILIETETSLETVYAGDVIEL